MTGWLPIVTISPNRQLLIKDFGIPSILHISNNSDVITSKSFRSLLGYFSIYPDACIGTGSVDRITRASGHNPPGIFRNSSEGICSKKDQDE